MDDHFELQKFQRAAVISKRVAELQLGSPPLINPEKLQLYDSYSVAKYEFENDYLKYEITLKQSINSSDS